MAENPFTSWPVEKLYSLLGAMKDPNEASLTYINLAQTVALTGLYPTNLDLRINFANCIGPVRD